MATVTHFVTMSLGFIALGCIVGVIAQYVRAVRHAEVKAHRDVAWHVLGVAVGTGLLVGGITWAQMDGFTIAHQPSARVLLYDAAFILIGASVLKMANILRMRK